MFCKRWVERAAVRFVESYHVLINDGARHHVIIWFLGIKESFKCLEIDSVAIQLVDRMFGIRAVEEVRAGIISDPGYIILQGHL